MGDAARVQLFVGPAVPVPAGRDVIDALQRVTVEASGGGGQTGFELTFRLSNRSPLHTLFLVSGGAGIPLLRIVVAVELDTTTTVLVDGVMTWHEVTSDGGPTSTLTVRGTDLTAVMDLVPLDGLPYPAMPPSVRVLTALAKYAVLGVVPMVVPSLLPDVPIPIDRIPRHQGTDLAYIRALAEGAGHVFHLDPGPAVGMSRAWWGPDLRVGAPQPALDAALDGPHRNVDSLSFRFDKHAKELPVVFIQEPASKAPIPIPIPDVTPLNPPLGLVPPLPPKVTLLRDTAKQQPVAAAMTGLAHAARHGDAVFGSGTLDVARYGRLLRPRALVGVRGAGEAFDGLHYVTGVTTMMEPGSFTQSFTLARNGLLSTVPTVPTAAIGATA